MDQRNKKNDKKNLMKHLSTKLDSLYKRVDDIYVNLCSEGYWSNINEKDQDQLLFALKSKNCLDTIRELFPQYEDIIFSPQRPVGLKLLNIRPNDVGIDYGCMWGNLLVYAANNCQAMVGVDQTWSSLKFLQYRLKDEKLSNCFLLNTNLRENIELNNIFDFAIVNGVLEWIAEENKVEVGRFLKKKKTRFGLPKRDPESIQLDFLKMIHRNLKENGKLYLAIENRYDYQYFLWKRDPHPNIFYTAFLPRKVANLISNLWYGRPYVTYLYSLNKLEALLNSAGFDKIEKYAVFPDYRFPQKIIPLKHKYQSMYEPVYNTAPTKYFIKRIFRKVRRVFDIIVYQKLKLFNLAPSFILIAKKS